jgi:hypothetical protein
MPTADPRDPHAAERLAERERAYNDMLTNLDTDAHLTPAAVANCTICDTDGYRPNGTVCDHIDRSATAKAGIAKCRDALRKAAK